MVSRLVSLLLYDIAKYGIATVWEAPMDGLGRSAFGQQSGVQLFSGKGLIFGRRLLVISAVSGVSRDFTKNKMDRFKF